MCICEGRDVRNSSERARVFIGDVCVQRTLPAPEPARGRRSEHSCAARTGVSWERAPRNPAERLGRPQGRRGAPPNAGEACLRPLDTASLPGCVGESEAQGGSGRVSVPRVASLTVRNAARGAYGRRKRLVGSEVPEMLNLLATCGHKRPGNFFFGANSLPVADRRRNKLFNGYQDQKLAPEANTGKPHCLAA